MAYVGLDGKNYFSYEEMKKADGKFQKELVNEQVQANKTIAEQQMNLETQNVQAQINNQITLERERQKHEEEMRNLRLFDDIGINRSIFEKFIDYIFSENISEKDNKKLEEINSKLEEKSKRFNFLCNLQGKKESYKKIKQNFKKNNASYRDFKSYSEVLKSSNDFEKYRKARETLSTEDSNLMEKIIKYQDFSKKFMWGLIILNILIFILMNKYFITLLIIPVIIICAIKFRCSQKKKIMSEIDILIEKSELLNESDNLKEIEILKNQIEKLYSEKQGVSKALINIKWGEFYKYRLNHYNSKIEKLLLDLNIPQLLKEKGLNYVTVNKDKAKSNGDIDDYISYFQSKM